MYDGIISSVNSPKTPTEIYNAGEGYFFDSAIQYSDNYSLDREILYQISPDGSFTTCIHVPTGAKKQVVLRDDCLVIGQRAFSGCRSVAAVSVSDEMQTIGVEAFSGCSTLKQIPSSISLQNIEDYAFEGCTALQDISMAGSSATFGLGAFSDCTSLAFVTLQGSFATLGQETFKGCTALYSVTLGTHATDSIVTTGTAAFQDCTGLELVTIEAQIGKYGLSTFEGCKALTDMRVEEGAAAFTTFIDEKAFKGCVKLHNLTLSKYTSLETIADEAFSDCDELSSVFIPASVSQIGNRAFYNMDAVTQFAVANNSALVGIGSEAFSDCSRLSLVMIDSAPVFHDIGSYAFKRCTNLSAVYLPDNCLESLGEGCFSGCDSLSVFDLDGSAEKLVVGQSVFKGCMSLQTMSFASTSLTSLPENAFEDCDQLYSLELPASVSSLGSGALKGCTALRIMTLDSESVVALEEGSLDTSLTEDLTVTVPYTVGHGVRDAYRNDAGWQTVFGVNIDHIVDLGEEGQGNDGSNTSSFYVDGGYYQVQKDGTYKLLYLAPEHNEATFVVTPKTSEIADGAFKDHESLTMISMPTALKKVGASVFEGCSGLESVCFNAATPPRFEGTLFGSSQPNANFRIYAPSGSVAVAGGYGSVQALYSYNIIGSGVRFSIAYGALYSRVDTSATDNSEEYELLYVPRSFSGVMHMASGVRYVREKAAEGCTGITGVEYVHAIREIGDRAFAGCTSMIYITMGVVGSDGHAANIAGSKLEKLGNEVFEGCSSLVACSTKDGKAFVEAGRANFLISAGVTSVGTGLFKNCTSLLYVQWSCPVYDMPAETYMGCTSLVTSSVATSVSSLFNSIGDRCYYGCTSLGAATGANMSSYAALTSIGSECYAGDSQLTLAMIPASVTSIGANAFAGCDSIRAWGSSATTPMSFAGIGIDPINWAASTVFIPAGTGEMYLEQWNTDGLGAPGSIYDGGRRYTVVSGCVYDSTLGTKKLTFLTATVPNATLYVTSSRSYNVLAIADDACAGNDALESFTSVYNGRYSADLKTLGARAFKNCSNLRSVTLSGDAIQGLSVGEEAFANCIALTELTIPNAIRIESNTISGSAVEELTLSSSLNYELRSNSLAGCTSLKQLKVTRTTPSVLRTNVFGDVESGKALLTSGNFHIVVPSSSENSILKSYIAQWGTTLMMNYGFTDEEMCRIFKDDKGTQLTLAEYVAGVESDISPIDTTNVNADEKAADEKDAVSEKDDATSAEDSDATDAAGAAGAAGNTGATDSVNTAGTDGVASDSSGTEGATGASGAEGDASSAGSSADTSSGNSVPDTTATSDDPSQQAAAKEDSSDAAPAALPAARAIASASDVPTIPDTTTGNE